MPPDPLDRIRKLSPTARLAHWVRTREKVRLRKEAGSDPPWTTDPILQRYRFTNVRRMDDKVSRWLLDNWYRPFFNHPDMLAAVALARFVNKPDTLWGLTEHVFTGKKGTEPWWQTIKSILNTLKKNGPIFNAAYMVRGEDGLDKVTSVVDRYCRPLDPKVVDRRSMAATHAALMPFHGMGSFMAGQIVADLRWAVAGDWEDKMMWAPIGPGSRRGMNRLRGREVTYPLSQEQFLRELTDLIEKVGSKLDKERRLEAHDWQNVLCETDKYTRVLLGEGEPKQRYPGGG